MAQNKGYLQADRKNKSEGRSETMTEPQQKYLDELFEQLQEELECCEDCPDRNTPELCDGCGTHGNIKDFEMMIHDMTETE